MDGSTIVFLSLITLILFYILCTPKRPKNFPPGPRGIPIFGNALQLGIDGFRKTSKLTQKYGPIVGFQLGSNWAVFLDNPDDIREAFGRSEFAGRGSYNFIQEELITEHTRGLGCSIGRIRQAEKRFCLKTLRDFGLGRKSLEEIIQEETADLLEVLHTKIGQPIKTDFLFNGSAVNVIWAIVAGERFSRDDPRLSYLLQFANDIVTNSASGLKFLKVIFPWMVTLRSKFPWLFYDPEGMKMRSEFCQFLKTTIDEHRATMKLGNLRDYIDAYLEQIIRTADDPNSVFKSDNDYYGLSITLMDIFVGGSETTSTTLMWALFLLALNPKKQVKMYDELKSVVGRRTVKLGDRESLPYGMAVMNEILRVGNPLPGGIPRSTLEDVVFKGFHIPKDTIIFGNAYAVHNSNGIWGDPENFRPERFLSPDQKTFVRNPNVIPFGSGKRQCLGEGLARDEFFVFLTNIVLQFKITMPSDEPPHSLVGVAGLTVAPEKHNIILLNRKDGA